MSTANWDSLIMRKGHVNYFPLTEFIELGSQIRVFRSLLDQEEGTSSCDCMQGVSAEEMEEGYGDGGAGSDDWGQ